MHLHGCQQKLVSKVVQRVTETSAGGSRLLSVMKVEFHCHANLSNYCAWLRAKEWKGKSFLLFNRTRPGENIKT